MQDGTKGLLFAIDFFQKGPRLGICRAESSSLSSNSTYRYATKHFLGFVSIISFFILQPNQIMLISAFTVQDCHFLWDFTWNLMNYWLCDVTKDWHDWLFWPSFFFICKSDEQLYLPLYLLGGLDEIFTKFQYIAELWINILQTFILILLIYFISPENIKFIPFLKTQKETQIFLCSLFAIHWFSLS